MNTIKVFDIDVAKLEETLLKLTGAEVVKPWEREEECHYQRANSDMLIRVSNLREGSEVAVVSAQDFAVTGEAFEASEYPPSYFNWFLRVIGYERRCERHYYCKYYDLRGYGSANIIIEPGIDPYVELTVVSDAIAKDAGIVDGSFYFDEKGRIAFPPSGTRLLDFVKKLFGDATSVLIDSSGRKAHDIYYGIDIHQHPITFDARLPAELFRAGTYERYKTIVEKQSHQLLV